MNNQLVSEFEYRYSARVEQIQQYRYSGYGTREALIEIEMPVDAFRDLVSNDTKSAEFKIRNQLETKIRNARADVADA